MAKLGSRNTRLWLDHFKFAPYVASSDLDIAQEAIMVDTLGQVGPERVVDLYAYSLKHGGFFDGVGGAVDEAYNALIQTDAAHYVAQLFQGEVEGGVAYESVVQISDRPHKAVRGQAQMLDFNADGASDLSRGLVLRAATLGAAGNGTGRNHGATVAKLVVVLFRLFSFTGTSITMKIQSSTDNGVGDAYADVAGLATAALTTPSVVRKTTSANTEAWKRLVASGTFSSAVVGVTIGVAAQQ